MDKVRSEPTKEDVRFAPALTEREPPRATFTPLKEIDEFSSIAFSTTPAPMVATIDILDDPSKLAAPLKSPPKAISLATDRLSACVARVEVSALPDRSALIVSGRPTVI